MRRAPPTDRAQARRGLPEPRADRLRRVGFGEPTVATLSINYRTPAEVIAAAGSLIRAALPDANVPTSVRSTGVPVAHGTVGELDELLASRPAEHPQGVACVVGADREVPGAPRIRSLSPAGGERVRPPGAAGVTVRLVPDWVWTLVGVLGGVLLLWLALVVALWASRPDELRLRELLRLLPDVVRLVRRLAADRALERGVRVRLWLLLGYLALPFDLVPDVIPVLGWADDAIVVALVLRSVVRRAGPEALERHWPGSPEGLAALRRVARLPG